MIEIKLTGETPEDVFAQMRVFLGQEGKSIVKAATAMVVTDVDVPAAEAPVEKKTRAKKEVAAPAPELVKDAPKGLKTDDLREKGKELISVAGIDALRELNVSFGIASITQLEKTPEKFPAFLKSCQEKIDAAKAIAEAV